MRLLVVGGAGYVGAITGAALAARGHEVVVYDNLSTGHREAVSGTLVVGDVRDREHLAAVLQGERFDGVLHFAALALVGESGEKAALYRDVNVAGTAALIAAMEMSGVAPIVFSGSCSVYGNPAVLPVDETAEFAPTSVYGETKVAAERLLGAAPEIRPICLRYFNAAGAWPEAGLGESHPVETHLIPLALGAALGTKPPLVLFGDDHPTPDGTCQRDYVHVRDLAAAHVAAIEVLGSGAPGGAYNLGYGRGISVNELLAAVERHVGRPVPHSVGPRRAGDPAAVWADVSRADRQLGWRPERDLDAILADALVWERERRF